MPECEECGQEFENLLLLELDPPIKISGFSYPHEFEICGGCAREIYQEEKESPSGCKILINGEEVLSY